MSRRYSCKGAALESFCTGLFTAYGFDPHAAAAISRQLVSADMRGMPSHGVVRVEMYLTHARKGAIDPTAKPEIVKETPTTAVIEGHKAAGAVTSELGAELARKKAEAYGLGFVTVRNSNHHGTCAYWGLQMAQRDMIAFVASNTPVSYTHLPLLYAALFLLTGWKNLQAGIWEWTWTFQISARMVAALRMLCFGGLSVLACVPANLALWALTGREMPLGWMLALSLASLFLYGALSLLCQRLRGPASLLGAPTGWVLLSLVPLIWPRAAEWLTAVPTLVFCLLAAAGITMYLLELRRFCRRPMEGGVSYALR